MRRESEKERKRRRGTRKRRGDADGRPPQFGPSRGAESSTVPLPTSDRVDRTGGVASPPECAGVTGWCREGGVPFAPNDRA